MPHGSDGATDTSGMRIGSKEREDQQYADRFILVTIEPNVDRSDIGGATQCSGPGVCYPGPSRTH